MTPSVVRHAAVRDWVEMPQAGTGSDHWLVVQPPADERHPSVLGVIRVVAGLFNGLQLSGDSTPVLAFTHLSVLVSSMSPQAGADVQGVASCQTNSHPVRIDASSCVAGGGPASLHFCGTDGLVSERTQEISRVREAVTEQAESQFDQSDAVQRYVQVLKSLVR